MTELGLEHMISYFQLSLSETVWFGKIKYYLNQIFKNMCHKDTGNTTSEKKQEQLQKIQEHYCRKYEKYRKIQEFIRQ